MQHSSPCLHSLLRSIQKLPPPKPPNTFTESDTDSLMGLRIAAFVCNLVMLLFITCPLIITSLCCEDSGQVQLLKYNYYTKSGTPKCYPSLELWGLIFTSFISLLYILVSFLRWLDLQWFDIVESWSDVLWIVVVFNLLPIALITIASCWAYGYIDCIYTTLKSYTDEWCKCNSCSKCCSKCGLCGGNDEADKGVIFGADGVELQAYTVAPLCNGNFDKTLSKI